MPISFGPRRVWQDLYPTPNPRLDPRAPARPSASLMHGNVRIRLRNQNGRPGSAKLSALSALCLCSNPRADAALSAFRVTRASS